MQRFLILIIFFMVFKASADDKNLHSYIDVGYSYNNRPVEPNLLPFYGLKGNSEGFFIEASFQPKQHFYWGLFLERKESDFRLQGVELTKNLVVAKYGVFTGYEQNINNDLSWFAETKLFRIDSGSLGLDRNGMQLGGGLQHSLTDHLNLKGGVYLSKIRDTDESYPTVDLEAVYRIKDNYRFRINLQNIEGELGGQIGLGYDF
jgi:hypothetical protein